MPANGSTRYIFLTDFRKRFIVQTDGTLPRKPLIYKNRNDGSTVESGGAAG